MTNTGNSMYELPASPLLTITLCMDEESIWVNQGVLDTLNHPRQIQMLINEERQMLLVQPCTVDDREAIVIPGNTMNAFEMSGHCLLKRIRRLTGWNDHMMRTVNGVYLSSHNAIIFDLSTARPVYFPAVPQMPGSESL